MKEVRVSDQATSADICTKILQNHKRTGTLDKVRLFSDQLKEQEEDLGKLLKEISSELEDNHFPDRAAMLTLRTQFLYRRADSMLRKMQELLEVDQSEVNNSEANKSEVNQSEAHKDDDLTGNEKAGADRSEKHLPLTILSQQMILAEQQKTTLRQLYESLQEMQKAKSATPRVEHLVLLRQLKDRLEEFERKDIESDGGNQ